MSQSLTYSEDARMLALTDHEATIERGLKTFVDVGNALAAIRDGKLYKADHATFEDYCKVRWGWTRVRAYQLIDAAGAADDVKHALQIPASARQAEALAKAPKEERAEVWEEVLEDAEATGEKITAKKVEAVVAKRREPKQSTKRSAALAEREMLKTNTCTLVFDLNNVEATAQLIAHNCDEGYLAELYNHIGRHL